MEDVRRWLGTHCSQELVVKKLRFDYYDNIVEVFLHEPSRERTQLIEWTKAKSRRPCSHVTRLDPRSSSKEGEPKSLNSHH